jgi:hypothetical protein
MPGAQCCGLQSRSCVETELPFNLKSGKKNPHEINRAITFFSLLPVTLHAQGTPKEKTAAPAGAGKRTDV